MKYIWIFVVSLLLEGVVLSGEESQKQLEHSFISYLRRKKIIVDPNKQQKLIDYVNEYITCNEAVFIKKDNRRGDRFATYSFDRKIKTFSLGLEKILNDKNISNDENISFERIVEIIKPWLRIQYESSFQAAIVISLEKKRAHSPQSAHCIDTAVSVQEVPLLLSELWFKEAEKRFKGLTKDDVLRDKGTLDDPD